MALSRETGATRGDFVRLFEGASSAGLGDGELLGRFVARRDEAAFEALVVRLGPMVLGVCRRMLAAPHDVDDAFQATFLVLVRRAGAIRNRDAVSTWLYEVAVRVARRARADSARRADRERRAAVSDEGEEHEPRLERSEVRARIDEEIGRLPESHRRLIVLCDVEGLSREEAAARLGWTANMVRGRLERARARLRQRLTRRGLAPSGASLVLALPSAVPKASLVAATVRAALGGAGSAISLSEGAIGMMIMAQWKLAIAALVSAMGVFTAVVAMPQSGTIPTPTQVNSTSPVKRPVRVQAPRKQLPKRRFPDLNDPPSSGPFFVRRPIHAPDEPEPSMEGAPKSVPVQISGLIRDIDEIPVAGATVLVLATQVVDVPTLKVDVTVAAKGTTGADGRYSFPGVPIPTSRYRKTPQSATPFLDFRVVALAPKLGIGWHKGASMYALAKPHHEDIQGRMALDTPAEMDVYLRPETPLQGRIVDESGKPVAGVKVEVHDIGLLDERARETAVSTRIEPGLMPDDRGRATTDAEGRFRISGMPLESCCWVFFDYPGRNTGMALYASTSAKAESEHADSIDLNRRSRHVVYPADMTVTMATPRRLDVRVFGSDDGEPVPNVHVNSVGESMATGVHSGGTTDAAGRVALDLPAGRCLGLSVDPASKDSRFLPYSLPPFIVADDPKPQPIVIKLNVGAELAIEVVDADTGEGIPQVRFDIKAGPEENPWDRLRSTSRYSSSEVSTDAAGKVKTVLSFNPALSYQVRVAGVGLEVAVGRINPDGPPTILPSPDAERLPYDAVNAVSDPFEPMSGTPTRLRFTLRKQK